jgi:polar amino acid transport system substrate-binding protein
MHSNCRPARSAPVIFWLLITLVLGAARGVHAREDAPLTCYSTAFEPFVIQQANGDTSGIDVDVIAEIAARSGLNIRIGLKPWLRLEQDFREGHEVSCGFAYSRTAERLAYMQFTEVPLHTTEYVLFYRRDRLPEYHGLESMRGRTIAVNRGFRRPAEFDEALAAGQFKLFEVTQDRQSMQMLERGRIDAVLANLDVGRYLIKQLGLSEQIVAGPPLSSMPTFLVFSLDPRYAAYVPRFDQALRQLIADGTYQRIFDRYTRLEALAASEVTSPAAPVPDR